MDTDNSVVIARGKRERWKWGGMNGDEGDLTWGGEHIVQYTDEAL